MPPVYHSIVAWRNAMESVLTLGSTLSGPQWAAPTECPEWTVKDVYAHLLGIEQWVADGAPPVDLPMRQWVAKAVDAYRTTPPGDLLADLRRVYELRRTQLDRGGIHADQPVNLPTGQEGTVGRLLQLRAFDVWVHEQDIRRATGRPGNLDSPGAAIAAELFVSALPRIVAKSAQAPPGSSVRLTTTGQVPIDLAVTVGPDGRGTVVAPDRPVTCHLTISWEAYARLSCGRGGIADHDVTVTGDRQLAAQVLAHLSITP